jgi:thioredoxin
MKKTFLILFVVLSLMACNNTPKEENSGTEKQDETVTKDTVQTETKAVSETGKVIHLNNASFREKIHDYKANPKWSYKGDLPCIIDFYADWCRPCKELSPVLDELAKEYQGKIHIYKVNTDIEGELSNFYGVQYLPTLLLCNLSGEPNKQVGGLTKAGLKSLIEKDLLD